MTYRRVTALLLAGFMISLAGSGVARSQEENEEEKEFFGLKASGDVVVGGRVYGDRPKDDERAKFEEYRDLSETIFLDWLRLRGDSKDDFYTIEILATNGGLDDQNFQLRSFGVGSFDFLFEWDQTPHNISRNSQTLFVEGPDGTFSLPTPRPADPTTGLTIWNSAPKIEEIGFRTDTALVDFSYAPTPDWDIGVDFRRTYKHGNRPLGFEFGTRGGYATEVPLPVKDTTYDVGVSAAYAGDSYQLQFNYLFSLFNNDIDALRVDNPCFGLTAGPPAGCGSFDADPPTAATGQGALSPDNYAHTFTLAGGVSLPMRTRLNSSFTYSLRKQDQAFLPFTINPALAASMAAAQAALPNDLDGEVSILRFNLSATSRPMDDLTATAKFRVYDYNDKGPEIPFTAYVEGERDVISGTSLPLRAGLARRYPYTKWNAGGDVRYKLFDPVALKVGFYWEQWNRNAALEPVPSSHLEEGGDSVLHVPREVDNTNEYTPKVMLDLTPLDWLLFRVSYAYSKRDGTNYLQASEEQLALLRKFDMADRKRHRVDLLADLIPIENLMFTTTFNYTTDDYNDSQYGLQDAKSWAAGVDATWKPLDWLSVFAGYVHEEWDNQSRLKFRTPSGDELNNPTYDWISDTEDRYDTVRVGLKADLIPELLEGGVNWNYSIGHTDMNQANPVTPVGGSSSSAVAEDFPGIRTDLSMLNVFLRYWISEQFTAKVQWSFETFHESDFRQDGLQPFNPLAPSNGDNMVYLGNNLLDYNASYFTFSVGYHF